jgi:beta-lactamase class C
MFARRVLFTRRAILRASAGLAGAGVAGLRPSLARSDSTQAIQDLIDDYYRASLADYGANVGVVLGVVTSDDNGRNGRLLFAGGDTLTNPLGKRIALDERTPFEIGSISKVMTSGIYYMLRGNYDGTLGAKLGRQVRLSPAMAAIPIRDLANYRPGLAQDNRGGVYPPGTMASLPNLFRYLATFTPPNPPGACYAYSNLGWSLLGMAAVGLDGTDTQAFVRAYDQSLVKYGRGFGATGTRVFQPDLKPKLPKGFTKQFAVLAPANDYSPTREAGSGSGGIVSNGADMMRFLLYSMGRLPGGLTDAALKLQQSDAVHTAPCSGAGQGPTTSCGWFHARMATAEGGAVVLNKNGGVAGFTSWMGFTAWAGTGAPSTHGVFVLSNSPASTRLGNSAMRLLLQG